MRRNTIEIESTAEKLFRLLSERLKNGKAARFDYNELALALGCARSTIRYNVGKLLSARLIAVRDGKLFLIK